MKKLLIFLFVIFTFGFYVVYQQSQQVPAVAPGQTAQTNPAGSVSSEQPTAPAPTTAPTPTPAAKPRGQYADGEYVGVSADAYYGNVQVKAIIQAGKITDVQFLDHPQDRRTSQMINNYAMPLLTQEAIQTQSANVDTISGATDTSMAFRDSLASALAKAKI